MTHTNTHTQTHVHMQDVSNIARNALAMPLPFESPTVPTAEAMPLRATGEMFQKDEEGEGRGGGKGKVPRVEEKEGGHVAAKW